jgi:hypothetical protein
MGNGGGPGIDRVERRGLEAKGRGLEVKGKQGRKESLRAFDARLDLPSRPL